MILSSLLFLFLLVKSHIMVESHIMVKPHLYYKGQYSDCQAVKKRTNPIWVQYDQFYQIPILTDFFVFVCAISLARWKRRTQRQTSVPLEPSLSESCLSLTLRIIHDCAQCTVHRAQSTEHSQCTVHRAQCTVS